MGFEPMIFRNILVFKTSALNRSAIFPKSFSFEFTIKGVELEGLEPSYTRTKNERLCQFSYNSNKSKPNFIR